MKVERSIRIDAPPEDVYAVVMDPHRLGEWVSIHDRLLEGDRGELDRGDELVQRLKVAGQRFTVRWQVTKDDRPRHVEWKGGGPFGARARVVYDFSGDGDGTLFTYLNEYELPGGAAGRLAGRAVGRAAARETERTLARLKQLIESG